MQFFYSSYHVFQDMQIGMRIGSGHEYVSIYYLDDGMLHSSLVAFSSSNIPL